jgi:hypothetical protein
MMRFWDQWWLKALLCFFGVGLLGWALVLGHSLVPASLADTTMMAGLILIAAKFAGVLILILGQLVVDTVCWLRNQTISWEGVRNFGEVCILAVLLTLPPHLAEQWYGINWGLALVVTVAVVLPIVWKPLRLRGPGSRAFIDPDRRRTHLDAARSFLGSGHRRADLCDWLIHFRRTHCSGNHDRSGRQWADRACNPRIRGCRRGGHRACVSSKPGRHRPHLNDLRLGPVRWDGAGRNGRWFPSFILDYDLDAQLG